MDIKGIQEKLQIFADERDWDKFHNPKNLVMALSVETSELVEIFQWLTESESSNLINNQNKLDQVRDEIADVAIYLIILADKLGVNIESAINKKLVKNASKYPAENVQGPQKIF